jgi:hypothetical protein
MPGQGANVCDLGRPPRPPALFLINWATFQVLVEPKINVIAGMAPMIGI